MFQRNSAYEENRTSEAEQANCLPGQDPEYRFGNPACFQAEYKQEIAKEKREMPEGFGHTDTF